MNKKKAFITFNPNDTRNDGVYAFPSLAEAKEEDAEKIFEVSSEDASRLKDILKEIWECNWTPNQTYETRERFSDRETVLWTEVLKIAKEV